MTTVLECRCYMGLFPEIERAWITVDHRLFLWDYQDGRVWRVEDNET